MAAQSSLLPTVGQVVGGKYVLKELIGQGGMGSVYAAEHTAMAKKVAIKLMVADPLNQEAIARFKREANAAGNLESEHIVGVHDVGEEKGYAFMVLELLRGEDLGKVIENQRGPLPVATGVQYVMQALEGISVAHAQGIIHRDLKPSNLFRVKKANGNEVIKVLDFGISKVASKNVLDEKPEALTSTKAMLGSPLYMSPEQLRSSKSIDHRADIWAIGVILYELLTSSLPFYGDTLGELFAAILEAQPTPPSARNASLPPGLDAVIMRCLRLRADERFASCEELKRALAPFASTQGHTVLGATAFMPGAPMTYPPGARATGPGAMTPPGGGPPSMQHAPQPLPVGAAATGSGVHPPVVKPAGQGGSSPQPAWQNTTGGGMAVPKSAAPLVALGIFVAIVVLGGVGGAVIWKRHAASGAPSSVASETPPLTPTTPASVASAPPSATSTTSAAADTSASASASVAANAKPPPLGPHAQKPPKTQDPPKLDPPKMVETPPPPPPRPTQQPTAKPTATSGSLEEHSR